MKLASISIDLITYDPFEDPRDFVGVEVTGLCGRKVKTMFAHFEALPDHTTDVTLETRIAQICNTINLPKERILTISCNSFCRLTKAVDLLEIPRIPCVARSLHDVLGMSVGSAIPCLQYGTYLISEYINRCCLWFTGLNDFNKSVGLLPYPEQRWHDIKDSLLRFLELTDATVHEMDYRAPPLKKSYETLLLGATSLLEPLMDAFDDISGFAYERPLGVHQLNSKIAMAIFHIIARVSRYFGLWWAAAEKDLKARAQGSGLDAEPPIPYAGMVTFGLELIQRLRLVFFAPTIDRETERYRLRLAIPTTILDPCWPRTLSRVADFPIIQLLDGSGSQRVKGLPLDFTKCLSKIAQRRRDGNQVQLEDNWRSVDSIWATADMEKCMEYFALFTQRLLADFNQIGARSAANLKEVHHQLLAPHLGPPNHHSPLYGSPSEDLTHLHDDDIMAAITKLQAGLFEPQNEAEEMVANLLLVLRTTSCVSSWPHRRSPKTNRLLDPSEANADQQFLVTHVYKDLGSTRTSHILRWGVPRPDSLDESEESSADDEDEGTLWCHSPRSRYPSEAPADTTPTTPEEAPTTPEEDEIAPPAPTEAPKRTAAAPKRSTKKTAAAAPIPPPPIPTEDQVPSTDTKKRASKARNPVERSAPSKRAKR